MDIANLVVAVIAALAACLAAYFAFKGPTQKDIKRVENNIADTNAELSRVRGHIAQVEGHLATQDKRQELAVIGQTVSIRVDSGNWNDENFELTFVVKTPEVLLKKIVLFNGTLICGTFDCTESSPGTFVAEVGTTQIGQWIRSGDMDGHLTRHRSNIRAIMEIDGRHAERVFAATIVGAPRGRPGGGGSTYYYEIAGSC